MNRLSINGMIIETCGPANISIRNGTITVNGETIKGIKDISHVSIKGNVNNITVTGDVDVEGDVEGDVDAGGNVTCEDVHGDIDAGGNVSAKNAKQKIDAGGNVHISK
jgi:hypothetical protein